jgi:dihydrofolate reductase
MLGIISCVSKNGIIGVNNFLCFQYKEDMKLFKETTENHIVVMGRNTFASMNHRPLPNRKNIVISSTFKSNQVEVHNSIQSVLDTYPEVHTSDDKWIWFIGGEGIYKEALELPVNLIILSVVDKNVELEPSDKPVYFPEINADKYEVSQSYKLCKDITVHLLDKR